MRLALLIPGLVLSAILVYQTLLVPGLPTATGGGAHVILLPLARGIAAAAAAGVAFAGAPHGLDLSALDPRKLPLAAYWAATWLALGIDHLIGRLQQRRDEARRRAAEVERPG